MRYPTQVTIEVTTVCNIMPPCVMCNKHTDPRSGWLNQDAAHFPKELIPKMASLLAEAEVLALYGIGEPLTCPYLFDFKQYVRPECHLHFVTNGLLLNAANITRIIDNKVSLVDVSLDASTPATYAKIRHNDFNAVVENVRQLIIERNRRGSIFPGVTLNMCLMRENIDDLPGLVQLAKDLGVNHCYAFHLNTGIAWNYSWFKYDEQHCSLEPGRHDERVKEAYQLASALGTSFEFKGQAFYNTKFVPNAYSIDLPSTCFYPTPAPALKSACLLPWTQVIVYKDGSVTNCCWQDGFMGSLATQTFDEIWQGATQKLVRDELLRGRFHTACSGKLLCPPRGRP